MITLIAIFSNKQFKNFVKHTKLFKIAKMNRVALEI